MVNPHHETVSVESVEALQYSVEEYALFPKTGKSQECEDAIYIGPYFVAVIDGVTSKSDRRWEGKTSGRVAAETIKEAFNQVPYNATAQQAIAILNAAIHSQYEHYNVLDIMQADPTQRPSAAFIAVSFQRREIWSVGDCQCLLDQQFLQDAKEIDEIAANARSLFLETELVQGKTIEELSQHDTGREFILPLLKRQMLFQNNPASGQYWFAVIDGFNVPVEGIRIWNLPADIETIVLASDGYPYLKSSLEESEQALHEVLSEDPLLFRKYRATKGLKEGQISFDDRAYVKLKIRKN